MRAVPQAKEMINLHRTAFQPLFCPIDLINRDRGYLINCGGTRRRVGRSPSVCRSAKPVRRCFTPTDKSAGDPGYLILTLRMNRCVRYGGTRRRRNGISAVPYGLIYSVNTIQIVIYNYVYTFCLK